MDLYYIVLTSDIDASTTVSNLISFLLKKNLVVFPLLEIVILLFFHLFLKIPDFDCNDIVFHLIISFWKY